MEKLLYLINYLAKENKINIGYQAKKDNAGGNGLIGNINVQTPCGQGV